MDVLASFHPAVRRWFEGRFPDGPSESQVAGWPAIERREHTLIAAPTGSGKTLAAFLVCLNAFYLRVTPDGVLREQGTRTLRDGGDGRLGEGEAFTLDPGPAPTRSRKRARGYVPLPRASSSPQRPRPVQSAAPFSLPAPCSPPAFYSPPAPYSPPAFYSPPAPYSPAAPVSDRPPGIEVLYISPLKALAADIQQNLEGPLAEIEGVARSMGLPVPEIRVGMRSGDTPPSARAAMLKKPPQILVTTPESLYLLLTSARGRETLRTVQTVIVDEIHAMARDKRGSHLALSLERLEDLCDSSPTRIGLSATQRPIELVAKLLVGVGPDRIDAEGKPRCTIVDEGHRRALDLETVLPGSELEAVASGEQMGEVLDRIAEQVEQHKTTLIFVNTRRMAERLAHQLAERLIERGVGAEGVAAHHGSLSRSRRLRVETALREGRLRALVATASLELGIDIGPVELVCQIGSPRSIATFLQRVGRSGHFRGGTPKGRIYPLTRDELVECTGLLRGVRAGRLDRLFPPRAPLDILAQQIVAACAAEPWKEADLFALCARSAPFEGLTREVFDEVVELVSEGIETGRGRRAAYLHRDRIGGQLRARRGARLAALTSGGAIPEVADYRVVADPDETFIGSVGEDFAIDSLPGDVFLLGSSTWRIRRVESGKVRVVDAEGANPNIPFWNGEAPARTAELSDEVSFLRRDLEPLLIAGDEDETTEWLQAETGIGLDAAAQVARYLGVSRAALGGLPTRDRLVLERFFDDAGGMQLVIHTPRGGRLNRALCLALRKKFCKSFNFELQAAANDDSMVLSLGPHHSFPLADVPHFLSMHGIEETLQQAVLPTPLFSARWRWNLNRSLAVLRFRGGKKNPPPIQRMESDDLMAAIFPQAAACQENVAGPIEIPDHVLVRQTLDDCLNEAMDVEGLRDLITRIGDGRLEILCVDTTEPSPLAHEILNGKPFTFLDDAPLEERRTRAVKMRRGLPVEERDLTTLAEDAIAKVREQATPTPRDRDELHDLLLAAGIWRADPRWTVFFRELEATGRAFSFEVEDLSLFDGCAVDDSFFDDCAVEDSLFDGCAVEDRKDGRAGPRGAEFWGATERFAWARALHPGSFPAEEGGREETQFGEELGEQLQVTRDLLSGQRGDLEGTNWSPESVAEDVAIAHVLRGHLETTGPIAARSLAARLGVRTGLVEIGLAALEAEGFVLRGRFESRDAARESEADQFCARRLLARIHSDSQARLRASVKPVSAQELMRFLMEWQHVAPGTQLVGPHGVGQIIEQLQGFDVAAGAWESEILASRVQGYRPEWLDPHCLSGQVSWLRIAPPTPEDPRGEGVHPSASALHEANDRAAGGMGSGGRAPRRARATSRSTPLSLVLRGDLPWLLQAHRKEGVAAALHPGAAALGLDAPALDPPTTALPANAPLADRIVALLERRGALFHAELVSALEVQPVEVEAALWDLVSRGRVGADGFQALRSLLGSRQGKSKARAGTRARRGLRRGLAAGATAGAEGRWSLAPTRAPVEDPDELAEAIAEQLLIRWGIVFRDVATRENLALPWREIVWALRRLEARGSIRGGRFISGFTGEQFALPEALEALARVCKKPRSGERIRVCGSDPLNLVGILTPGARVASLRTREVVYVDGLPDELEDLESAKVARSTPRDAVAEGKPRSARRGRNRRVEAARKDVAAPAAATSEVPPVVGPAQLELG